MAQQKIDTCVWIFAALGHNQERGRRREIPPVMASSSIGSAADVPAAGAGCGAGGRRAHVRQERLQHHRHRHHLLVLYCSREYRRFQLQTAVARAALAESTLTLPLHSSSAASSPPTAASSSRCVCWPVCCYLLACVLPCAAVWLLPLPVPTCVPPCVLMPACMCLLLPAVLPCAGTDVR